MRKQTLIDNLSRQGVDEEWLDAKIEELRKQGWKDHDGQEIRNIEAYLYGCWKARESSPFGKLAETEGKMTAIRERIAELKGNPHNWHRDEGDRWKHERENWGGYHSYVLGKTKEFATRYPLQFAEVIEEVEKMKANAEELSRISKGAEYSDNELIVAAMQIVFRMSQMMSFPQWARINAPFRDKGTLYPDVSRVVASLYDELESLRKEHELDRLQAGRVREGGAA